ncbi:hypothetical protein BDQ17DRAFT_1207981, partial [Cyathus striatus]
TSDECQIQELTRKAFETLGQEGIIECAKDHSCSESTNTDQSTQTERKPMVNIVVMDGIIMGPRHCAYQNCDSNLENERTGVFCIIHQPMCGHLCHIKSCNNPRENKSKTCINH